MPSVSIIMATRNNADVLHHSVHSILHQTFTDFEFIIVNDAATDDTQAILDRFQDKRLIILENTIQKHLPAALNLAFDHAQGQYIARMDGDDIALPARLATQVRFLEAHSQVGIVGTAHYLLQSNGKAYAPYTSIAQHHSLIAWRVFMGLPFVHPTIMLRRSVLEAVGGYDPSFVHGGEDSDLYTRLLGQTQFANITHPLLLYRQHRQSMTARNRNKRTITQRSRRQLASELVGYQVTQDILDDISAAYYRHYRLREDQAVVAGRFLTDLFYAMRQQGYFLSKDYHDAAQDYLARMLAIGRESPRNAIWLRFSPHDIIRMLIPAQLRKMIRLQFTGKPLRHYWEA